MTTVEDTCNRALSEIGTQTTIDSINDLGPAATQCKLWYNNQRQSLLRAAPWGFGRTQLALTEVGSWVDNTAPYPFLYAYTYPADCLKFRYILAPPCNTVVPPEVDVGPPGPYWGVPSRAWRYLVMHDATLGKIIVSNVRAAIGVYTADITDPDLFDSMFESALAASLAYKLVIPLSGNVGMREQFRASAEGSIQNARAVDGNEAIPSSDAQVDWLTARGVGGYGGGYGYGGPDWGAWNCSWDSMGWGM